MSHAQNQKWQTAQDAKEQQLGPEDLCSMLHAAGANRRLATEGWVCNQYCWVVWKLAAYERTYPDQLQGKLLTSEVILDQLKFRCDKLPVLSSPLPFPLAADWHLFLYVNTVLWPYYQAAIGHVEAQTTAGLAQKTASACDIIVPMIITHAATIMNVFLRQLGCLPTYCLCLWSPRHDSVSIAHCTANMSALRLPPSSPLPLTPDVTAFAFAWMVPSSPPRYGLPLLISPMLHSWPQKNYPSLYP